MATALAVTSSMKTTQDQDSTRDQQTSARAGGKAFWTADVFANRTRLMKRSAIRESLKLTSQREVISFAGGLPAADLFPMDRVKAAMAQVLTSHGPASLQYSETEGIGALRDWIAEQSSLDGTKVTRENILITTGAQQALHLLGLVFLNEGAQAGVENPTYLALLSCWRPLGTEFFPVRSNAEGIDPEALDKVMTLKPRIIYVCPNFQNPQGTTMPLETRERLVEACIANGVVLIEDDAYGKLRYSGEAWPSLWSLSAKQNQKRIENSPVIHVGSFSKVLMPGLRLGWVAAPKLVIEKLVLAKQAADLHTSTLNQYLALELLQTNYLEEVVPRLINEYKLRRDTMLTALERHFSGAAEWTRPAGGMFVLVTLPVNTHATALLPLALERKVAYVPGEEFFADGSGKNTLRLNFSNANPARIAQGIKRLAGVVHPRA